MLRLMAGCPRYWLGAMDGVHGGLPPELATLKKKLETSQKQVSGLLERTFQTEDRRKAEAGILLEDINAIQRTGLLEPKDKEFLNGLVDKISAGGYIPSKSEIRELNRIVMEVVTKLKGDVPPVPKAGKEALIEGSQASGRQIRLALSMPPMSLDKLQKAGQQADRQIQSINDHLDGLTARRTPLQDQYNRLTEGLDEQAILQRVIHGDPQLREILDQMVAIDQEKQELEDQRNVLQDKTALLKPFQDQMERPADVNGSLQKIRTLRDTFSGLSDRFKTSLGDRLFGTIDSASVKTFGRVADIRGQLNTARDQMLAEVDNLLQIYRAKGGSPGALELLQRSADALRGMDGTNARARLSALQTDQARLQEMLNADVRAGRLPNSEKKLLLTLSSNVQKAIEGYTQGMEKAQQREGQIQADLERARAGGKPEQVKRELDILIENGNRLQNFQEALKSKLVINPEHVDAIQERATAMKQEMIRDLTALHRQFSETDASPKALTFISMQIDKLKFMNDPDALAEIRARERDLQALLTPADKTALQDIHLVVDKTIQGYQAFQTAAVVKRTELETQAHRLDDLTAAIKETTGTAGSGQSTAYSLEIGVMTPVPGLFVTGRVSKNFTFQRNSETGKIEVIHQLEGGMGVKGKLTPKTSVGGEIYGGGQTKYAFSTAEEAARFLRFLETGRPPDYQVPTPARVAYGGLKAKVEAGLPLALKVKGEAAVQVESERKPTGEEVSIVKGVLKGSLDVEMGETGLSVSVDAKITHKHKVTYQNDVHAKTQELTEVEMGLGVGVSIPSLVSKLGLNEEQAEALKTFVEQHKAKFGLQASFLLKVEFEGGKPVALSVGAQAKVTAEFDQDFGLFDVKASVVKESHLYHTAWLSQGQQGLERLETYFMADEELYNNTKGDLGWTGDTVIQGKTLHELEEEWRTKKEDLRLLKELRELYITNEPPGRYQERVDELGGLDHPIQGKTLREHAAIWEQDKGDRSILDDLKKAYLADRSTFRRTYSALLEERGFSSRTFLDGKALEQHQQDWEREYARAEKLRALNREMQALV